MSKKNKAHVSITTMLRFWSASVLAISLLQAVHGDFSYTAVADQDSLQYGDVRCPSQPLSHVMVKGVLKRAPCLVAPPTAKLPPSPFSRC